jgi:NAD(P)-dependent dehydrogenase (short-subunit alcohol dehydrogenase family)
VSETLFRLDGKVAAITGAGSGFGRAFSRGLAACGATIICGGRQVDRLHETISLIERAGGRAKALPVDVVDEGSVDRFWQAIATEFGRIDVLVNNAGMTATPARTHELAVSEWDSMIATNLRGAFLMTRQALKLMLPGPGSIINIASIAALRGYWPGFPSLAASYSSAKAGVIGLTRQVAAEYAKEKIRVNAIAPGWHSGTNITTSRDPMVMTPERIERFEKAIHQRIPMGHRGQADDLVGLVIYLASDASHYLTGQVLAHDGGWDAITA